jgi:hypothetical protein
MAAWQDPDSQLAGWEILGSMQQAWPVTSISESVARSRQPFDGALLALSSRPLPVVAPYRSAAQRDRSCAANRRLPSQDAVMFSRPFLSSDQASRLQLTFKVIIQIGSPGVKEKAATSLAVIGCRSASHAKLSRRKMCRIDAHASLARRDQARVRAELKDHLAELAAEARKHSSTLVLCHN